MQSDSRSFRKQFYGWLSYAFASEVFVIVSLTLFLPICLEQFARDNGFLLPDKTQSCKADPAIPATLAEDARCVVKIGWVWIDTASFSLYTNSLSVLLQALTVISVGSIADNQSQRKRLLLTFAMIGALPVILFLLLPSSSPIWQISALLAILANVGFGVSMVALNSYIPLLARQSPEVVALARKHTVDESIEHTNEEPSNPNDDSAAPLLSSNAEAQDGQSQEYEDTLSRATSRISSMGIALGYSAGIVLLLVSMVLVRALGGSTWSLRLAIGLSGIWWTLFSIPAAFWLPGKASTPDSKSADTRTTLSLVADSWRRLGAMLMPAEIKRLRNTFKYLGAWFLLSDGFTTITSTAMLFGKTSLHMKPQSLIIVGVLSPLCGVLGSLAWPTIQRRIRMSNLKVVVVLVLLASAIPFYGCLGFLFQGRTRFGGLTTAGEMYGLAVYFGFVYGAFQGYARALYAEMLPPGEEARWYGLYAITDKSSSFVGPLFVGLISDLTGNIRYSFFFLTFMIWLAVPILASVNVERGKKDAREYRSPTHERDDFSTDVQP